MMRYTKRFLLLLGACALLAACAPWIDTTDSLAVKSGSVQISEVWMRPTGALPQAEVPTTIETAPTATATLSTGVSSALYLTLRSTGDADRLDRIETDIARAVEIHASTDTNGVVSMSQVTNITIPAGGEVDFAPNGYHMMLLDVQRELKPGDKIMFNLQFEHAGTVPVEATVRDQ